MKRMQKNLNEVRSAGKARRSGGFTLLELLVATAIFLLIGGAAFQLFSKQQTSSQIVQGQVGLNLALRNAISQMQMDLVNAGSGFYQGPNVPGWPVGVTIVNNVVPSGSSCYNSTTQVYGASCFDKLNIIAADSTAPVMNATSSTGSTTGCSNTSAGVAYGIPTTGTVAAAAATFKQGDQLLFVNGTGTKITTAVLTQNATAIGSGSTAVVQFNFNATLNSGGSTPTQVGYNTQANDPLDITTCGGVAMASCAPAQQPAGEYGQQFCAPSDWILRLAPIIYSVDTTTASNPTLMRQVGVNGTKVPVMEQVIGFKVGASIWNADDTQPPYNYDASTYVSTDANDNYNYTLVRSVRISLIGRTVPNTNPNYQFRNAFDQGPYQVQGTAIVVNPRDLSMNDN